MKNNFRQTIYGWLRWSERYTKTDMVYLTKSGFWVLFGQITSSLISLVLVILFANLVSKETYGLYRYVLSLSGLLSIFTLSGMNQAVIQAVASGKEYILSASVKYQLKWNMLMLIAAIVLGTYYFIHNQMILAVSLLIMGIFSPLTNALNTYNAYLAGKKKFKLVNVFSFISTTIYAIGMMGAIHLGNDSVIWLIFAYALVTFLTNLVFYIIILKKYRLAQISPNESDTQSVLKYGRHLTFIDYLTPIISQLDSIVLNHFWGASALATYYLATTIPNRATSMLKSYTGIGFPKLSEKTPEVINSMFWRRILQGMIIGAFCTLAYIFISPLLFTHLLPKYLDGLFYSQLLSVSFIAALPNRYISLLLVSQKLSKSILVNSLTSSTTQILLYIILGIWGGILGLITAKVLFSFIGMITGIFIWRFSTRKNI